MSASSPVSVSAPILPVRGNSGPVQTATPVSAPPADVSGDAAFRGTGAALATQPPANEGQTGWVGVNEALYRLRSNWSPASHEGKSAVVSLPRPDVIAAYHRDEAASPAAEAERAAISAAHFDVVV